MSLPQAILFDFDGVLADTENVHIAAWERVFERMGWEVPSEVCAQAAEIDDRAFLRGLFGARGISAGDVEGWCRRKQEVSRALLADAPALYPGVAALIRALRSRTRLAVVSGAWRENIEVVLSGTGLIDAFELIIGKEDVTAVRVKPEPDVYRLALERLGLAGDQVVALEDSPTGLAAARGAGVRVVAVGHRRLAGEWSDGVPYLADLRDTAAVLERLGLTSDRSAPFARS